MLVNHNIIDNLCEDAGEQRKQKAQKYRDENRIYFKKVEYENPMNFEVTAEVEGTDIYNTYIQVKNGEIENITCTCPDYYNYYGVCKHTLATVLALADYNVEKIEKHENKATVQKEKKYTNFSQIVKTIYNHELNEIDKDLEDNELKNTGTIKIEPKIIYDKFTKEMKVEFKIGNKRMYKIKNLAEFYTLMMLKENYKYGDKLEFVHRKEMFDQESQGLLEFVLKYAEIIKYANSNANSNYRYYGKALNENNIILGNTGLDELFDIQKNKKVLIEKDYEVKAIDFLEEDPPLDFSLEQISDDEYKIIANFDIYKINILRGKNYKYVLTDKNLYRCSKEFTNTNLEMLTLFRENYVSEVMLGKKEIGDLFSIVLPKVKNAIKIEEKLKKEVEEYIPEKLRVKAFLDFDKNNYVVADVKLCYGENEFNPLNQKEEKNFKFPRNIVEETKAMNIFRKTGFMFEPQNLRFILPDDEKIYNFLSEDINLYMKKFEVLVTENFKTKEIVAPKVGSLGVRVENNLLEIDLSKLNINPEELQEMLAKYKLKKKFYRLKNGAFLQLQDSEEVEFLDKLITGTDIDYKELENGTVRLPVNRTLYLNQLLKKMKNTEITKDKQYREIVNNLNKDLLEEENIPQQFENILRPYQKTGFQWLKTLDNYRFGGILADDMGLGKTIQVISMLVSYKENQEENKKTSLVVSPSSLALNWKNEIEKFAPELNIKVISGNANQRKEIINEIERYDVIVTSYDLLKRDIEIYKEKNYTFRFIIADEAQYLKNNNAKNAKAIKQIKADSRFALTGTPIENSLAELWSIFDFVMPGYLFSYKKFKSTYETAIVKDNDEDAMKKLKMLIEPFVLRRTKKEVLTELPEKTITVLKNEMGEEQRKIYLSYLVRTKQELQDEINSNGYERTQIKILAALTRLRQICCHPSVFIDNYKEPCSKLEQCMEILEDGITAGHKILLFSSYTSMFEIIEKEFNKLGIKYYKLVGNTPVNKRVKMVDEFNNDSSIKVFLISLKAGGTGLNLTSADIVIHYDPWWNISAENQATDRAYRIGQKNSVQVYKLITSNSIEEKINKMQERKEKLSKDILSTEETFINKMSKEEILDLFE